MTLEQRLRSMRKTMRVMFGIARLRAGQEDIIRSVLERHDPLATMPTDAGKSLCDQLPALRLDGTALVVSPLIALMKDQADKLMAARACEAAQDAFMSGETRVVVATNAFGMGIDKSDIRFGIHYQMAGSLDAYYQETVDKAVEDTFPEVTHPRQAERPGLSQRTTKKPTRTKLFGNYFPVLGTGSTREVPYAASNKKSVDPAQANADVHRADRHQQVLGRPLLNDGREHRFLFRIFACSNATHRARCRRVVFRPGRRQRAAL